MDSKESREPDNDGYAQEQVWRAIVLIQLNRIYDVLCLLASTEVGSKKIDELIEFHKSGKTYSPPPAISGDAIAEEEND